MHAAPDVEKFLKKSYILRQNSNAPISASFFSVIRIIDVDFTLPDGDVIPLKCVGNHSVSQIKNTLLEKLSELQKNCDRFYENGFTLTYVLNDKIFEIGDMDQTFQTLKIVNIWMTSKCRGKLDVKQVHVKTDLEQLANVRFGALMGVIWSKYSHTGTTVNDEVNLTRRKLTNVRRKALEERCLSKYTMEAVIDDAPLPNHVSANIKENKFDIKVTLEKESEILQVDVNDFPKDILAKRLENHENSTNYTLKIFGKGEYIWEEESIINFSYIRKCITRRKTPHLVVCEQPDSKLDLPRSECDPWNYVDESTGVTQNHQQLTISASNKNHTQVVAFSLWDLDQKFRLKMIGVDYLRIGGWNEVSEKPDEVYVQASLYQGTQPLTSTVSTKHIAYCDDLRWDEWLELNISMRHLPKEAKLNINIVGVYRTSLGRMKNKVKTIKGSGDQDVILSWANKQVFDHRSTLCTGDCVMRMWPMIHNEDISFETYNGTTESNTDSQTSKTAAEVHFQLDTYMHPVVFPNGGWEVEEEEEELVSGSSEWKKVIEIVQSNSMYQLDEDSKILVRKYSNTFKSKPDSLPKLLQVVDFSNLNEVVWIHRLLKDWPDVSFEVALELLDERYVDEKVRSLAVRQLDRLSNQKLLVYMLQLTQALKFEPYHDSPLARFLITRALQSKRIGHYFFWYLRSEVENSHVSRRYSILMEAYLRGCGAKMLEEFSKQTTAINYLKQFSSKMNMKQSKQTTTNGTIENLREEISKLPLPKTFQAPYDPRIVLGSVLVDKTKIMDSKKKPIWLEFANGSVDESNESSNDSIKIIFKQGDDLRQDMLTLQMLTLMEQLWHQEGLDLCLLPYGCMSTGWQMGVIEIVPNATTVAKIQKEGAGLIRGAFKDEVLIKWLERKNPQKEKLDEAIETFMRSCAGYCVATYVLGIGDRHNDNIMVTESGNLFHIDFGHFLGNTKTFYGIQRERVPFVLTPDFVHVMGGEESQMFEHFKETCIRAYIIIRRNATLFLNLFHMMRSTGIPELNSVKDIDYLQKVLLLDTDETEARKSFLNEIVGVLRKSWTVQLNWMMHGFAHSTTNS